MSEEKPQITLRPKKVLCILGMHRSGTSCLSGSLKAGGLNFGRHNADYAQHNKKGNQENADIVDLHNDIMEKNSGNWKNPPKNAKWGNEHYARAKDILCEYSDVDYFGFKDPRALFVIDGWLKLVPDMQFVGIYRHPSAVAISLKNRNQFSISQGLEIWYKHNIKLLEVHKEREFPIMSFKKNGQSFQEDVAKICRELDLSIPSEQFYTESLQHSEQEDVPIRIPWKVRRTYRRLEKISVSK
ncbi:sulfotransferase [Patescibacteria group bacterium]